ncbi:MAG: DUF916 domain-containing protein [Armatimonadetes bacterium]|nr:DUF916 domain-containing protein [Armatimonadota bacterium]
MKGYKVGKGLTSFFPLGTCEGPVVIKLGAQWILTAFAVASLIGSPVFAAFKPKVSASGDKLIINSRVAIRFRAANGNLSPRDRARITAERIAKLVDQNVSPYLIFGKGTRHQGRVMAGETLICVVTPLDARLGRTTPLGLAGSWAANIRTLLLMPPLILSDRRIVVPLGENRIVVVSGAATGPISASSDSTEVVAATPGTEGRYVRITGKQIGRATITIEVEGETATLDVTVKKYAGSVPGSAFAEVTGNPCPTSLVAYAASQAALRNALIEPGASARIERIEGADKPLLQGTTRQVKVYVSIAGPSYIDYLGTCVVETRASYLPREDPDLLFYSNSPERFTKYQELFAGKLEPDKSTRILYHHQNAVGKRARLLVEIVNPKPSSAVFRVFKAASAPLVDTVLVGYLASAGFLRDQFYNASVIERIPGQSRLILVSDVLGHTETASGILQVRQIAGDGAYVRIVALPPELEPQPVGTIAPVPDSIALQLSDHVYKSPLKLLEAEYVVGKQWAFIPIGRHAIYSPDARRKLDGNYGVTYDIKVKVENPTDREKKIQVLFDPVAGLASGIFVIDGSFVSAKYAKPPKEVILATYRLKPGEIRNVRITTLPVAGSHYPATLVVRS